MKNKTDQLVQHFSEKGPVVLLESQSSDHPESRVSYLAALPQASIKACGEKIVIEDEDEKQELQSNPWDALNSFYSRKADWLFGYLGYDLKNSLEALHSGNKDPVQAPDLYFMVPGVLLKIHRKNNAIEILKGKLPSGISKKAGSSAGVEVGPPEFSVKRHQYLSRIREAQRRIFEGDFYEINLSHQLRAECTGRSFELYRRMKRVGPVPFGAFLQIDDISICCMSPERFLSKEGRRVFSQPIKGTTRRGTGSAEDCKLRNALRASIKNRAENLMIVDLVRNDLSRIATEGSVKVSSLFDIQTFGTVHQMVSTVEAESAVANSIEIIKACYPMGSMTGAPKISVMKAIEELENYRRGIYSGAIGYIQPNGDFDFNVVIRTAIISRGTLYYSVGGAITGDSDPEEEWEETLVKARALTKVFC